MTNNYIYTSTYKDIQDFLVNSNSLYVYSYSTEDRSHLVDTLIARGLVNVTFVQIEEVGEDIIKIATSADRYFLRSSQDMKAILKGKNIDTLYLDVTGLSNKTCAPLLKSAFECLSLGWFKDIRVVYTEPGSYDIKKFKTEGVFNDLSEKIEGIAPLPGFASIFPDNDDEIILVALLGFEGGRFRHMIENVQPPTENIIPVIGVPGFRLEYPYVAYWGNRGPLEDTQTWRRVRFAAANSLVDIYMLLKEIIDNEPNCKLKIAPIGTKPHAIGSFLFALKHPKNVELVYDNPLRKTKRTTGIGMVTDCLVSKLVEDN